MKIRRNKLLLEMEGKSWIEEERLSFLEPIVGAGSQYLCKLLVTSSYKPAPENKLKIELLPHQRHTVQAMWELEQIQQCRVDSSIFQSRAALLSEPPGSGKTIEMLWLLLHSQPRTRMELSSWGLPKKQGALKGSYIMRDEVMDIGPTIEVRRTYSRILPQTLIFVSKSVIHQWVEMIEKYTDLQVFLVDNVFSLRSFYHALHKGFHQDIVLVKNGDISGAFEVEEFRGTPLEGCKAKNLVAIIGELSRHLCWKRVVLDDFDLLKVPGHSKVIPALFTWFVSATRKVNSPKRPQPGYKTLREYLEFYRPTYPSIWSNRELITFFNVGCDPAFIETSIRASKVNYYLYLYDNPDEIYINLLSLIDNEESREVVEMLNGDALKTANKYLGIKKTSVAGIFQELLGREWQKYRAAVERERYLAEVLELLASHPPAKKVKDDDLMRLREVLVKSGPLSQVVSIIHNTPQVWEMIEDMNREAKECKEEVDKALQRVRNSLSDGECPITMEPLKEAIILRCCGLVISAEATVRIQELNMNCPKCRAVIKTDSYIYINETDHQDIVEENVEFDVLPKEGKYAGLIKIIRGEEQEKEVTRLDLPGLLVGATDLGEARDKKVIIFTSHAETMKIIENFLIQNELYFMKVKGAAKKIQDVVRRFNLEASHHESINLLLINGPKFCAGLNLQAATDLIFAGKINDKNIELQVAGRICRPGRVCNANIHYLLYQNEYQALNGGDKRNAGKGDQKNSDSS